MGVMLSDLEIKELYEYKVKLKYFNPVAIPGNKRCIFLGGQPGCGKSYLGDAVIKELENKSSILIDTDRLREHHPKRKLISHEKLYSLDPDVFKIGDLLIDDTIKSGKNIIFDGTLGGDVTKTLSLIDRFKKEGYKIEIAVLAVNEAVSKIGIEWRYAKQVSESGSGRSVNREYHDTVYQNIPINLEKLLATNKIDTLSFYGRNHETKDIYVSKTIKENNINNSHKEEIKAFINEREREFTNKELNAIKSWFGKTLMMCAEVGIATEQFIRHILNHHSETSDELKKQLSDIVNLKNENNLEGVIGCDPIIKNVNYNSQNLKVAAFTLAEVQDKKVIAWHNVHILEKDFPKSLSEIKKGDLLKVEGNLKLYASPEGFKKEYVINHVLEHKRANEIDVKVDTVLDKLKHTQINEKQGDGKKGRGL